MTTFSVTVDIQASSNRGWDVLCDVERWPEWTSTVTSLERIEKGPFVSGCRARIRQPELPPAIWQVTELDEKKNFTWVTHSPGVKVQGEHLVEAVGEGSKVTLRLKFSGLLGPVVAWFYRDLNERYLAIEATGLKGRCEAIEPPLQREP